jgi:hypothetical protein
VRTDERAFYHQLLLNMDVEESKVRESAFVYVTDCLCVLDREKEGLCVCVCVKDRVCVEKR